MQRAVACALLCAVAIGITGPAYAQDARETSTEAEYTFEGHLLRITQGASSIVVDLGCAGRSALRTGAKLLVACGPAGVVEVDLSDPLSPRRDGTMQVDGDATGLFLHDGSTWVEVAHTDARPVRIGAPSSTSVPPLSPTAHAPAPEDIPSGEPPKEPPGIIAPPRRGGLWEIAFLTSAFVGFGSLGGVVLGSASVAYRFQPPLVLRAEAAP